VCASTNVRRPDEASRVTAAPRSLAASAAVSPNTISGAPSTQVPAAAPANDTALHFRADEKGILCITVSGTATGKGSRRHCAVALASSAAPYQASTSRQPSAGCISRAASKRISPAVSVPVLSRQMMSTRARPSTAGNSLTSTFSPARRAAPTANAMEVMSTRPSGIIAVSAAIVLTTARDHVPCCHACTQPPATIICAFSTSSPMGPMPQPTHRRTRSIDVRSSLETSWNRLASDANALAYDSAPTRVTRAVPSPATTIDPDSASSPGLLSTASDSPVSIDSSICRARVSTTTASAGTWSPARRTSRSSRTTSAGAISASTPSRRTRARGAFSSARRSSAALARNSCTQPITAFESAATPNSASCQRPRRSSTRKHAPTIPLNSVKTLARTMFHAERLLSATKAFV